MIAVGIDYSMTCPAACVWDDTQPPKFWFAHESKQACDPDMTSDVILPGSVTERAARTGRMFLAWLFANAPSVRCVAIEDYAFNATGRVFHIGENTGILKHLLDRENIAHVAYAPTAIKKFATGKGNADKQKMTSAFLNTHLPARKWVSSFFPRTKDIAPPKSPLADLADAYWIAQYHCHLTG